MWLINIGYFVFLRIMLCMSFKQHTKHCFDIHNISFFILFLTSSQIFGQSVVGKLIDNSNNTVIPYVVIINIENQSGTYSDSLGNFNLTLNNNKLNQIQFSRVGYLSKIINFSYSSSKDTIITLEPNPIQLGEIKVTSKKQTFKKSSIGYFKKIRGLYTYDFNPNRATRVATFINTENILNEDSKIKTLQYRLSSKKSEIATSYRIRLRIMEDFNGKPNIDLLKDDIIIDISTEKDFLEFDIEYLNLKIPVKGFWLGFDVIGYTDKKDSFNLLNTMKYGKLKNTVAPWIAMEKGVGQSLQSIWGNKWFMSKQQYHIFMFGIEYLIPK